MTFRSMKRLIAGISLLAALAPLGSAQAATAVVTKTIQVPTVFQGAGFDKPAIFCQSDLVGCLSKTTVGRHARCLYLTDKATAQDSTTGKLGYVTAVSSTWIGHSFTLKDVTGLAAPADFDIFYYSSLGDCVSVTQKTPAGDVAYGESPAPSPMVDNEDSFTHIGNEAGKVPAGAKFALIVMTGAPNNKFTLTIV